MKYLGYPIEELNKKGGYNTAKEISNQPDLWKKTYMRLVKEKKGLSGFLDNVLKNNNPYIIFTGAGTSAFVGESLVGAYQRDLGVTCRAIATTDIITHPENYFIKSRPTLLISIARSGDSPESVAALEIARKHCDNLYELAITCNKQGHLAKKSNGENSYVFLLPDEANDRSLAMTGSYSSMLLAGLLILNIGAIEQMGHVVNRISELGKHIIDNYLSDIRKISGLNFKRAVFLGSGPLLGTAHESHLKVQELSNGFVLGKFDSFLGFRHGPKAVVDKTTLIIYLLSNNPFSKPYEMDLIRSVQKTNAGEKSVAIGNLGNDELKFDLNIQFPDNAKDIPEDFLSVLFVLPAQIIGFFKSLNLGLSPDCPSTNGAISRVVQGVEIYHAVSSDFV